MNKVGVKVKNYAKDDIGQVEKFTFGSYNKCEQLKKNHFSDGGI